MSPDQYANQDPATIYQQLSPDQRAAVAQQFIQGYKQQGNTQWGSLDPNSVTPQQLAQMHQDARQNHPGLLGDVMRHPVVSAALGGFAVYEIHKHVEEHRDQQQPQI